MSTTTAVAGQTQNVARSISIGGGSPEQLSLIPQGTPEGFTNSSVTISNYFTGNSGYFIGPAIAGSGVGSPRIVDPYGSFFNSAALEGDSTHPSTGVFEPNYVGYHQNINGEWLNASGYGPASGIYPTGTPLVGLKQQVAGSGDLAIKSRYQDDYRFYWAIGGVPTIQTQGN